MFYRAVDPYTFTKTKTDCTAQNEVPYLKHVNPILRGNVNSSRTSEYTLSKDLTFIDSISTSESHEMRVAIKRDVGGSVSAQQKLSFIGELFRTDIRGRIFLLR